MPSGPEHQSRAGGKNRSASSKRIDILRRDPANRKLGLRQEPELRFNIIYEASLMLAGAHKFLDSNSSSSLEFWRFHENCCYKVAILSQDWDCAKNCPKNLDPDRS